MGLNLFIEERKKTLETKNGNSRFHFFDILLLVYANQIKIETYTHTHTHTQSYSLILYHISK